MWWSCGQCECVAAGLWLLVPCHSSGRCFMACSGAVPLASTVACSPGAMELHLKMIVRRDWRKERYYVVLHPLTFLQNSEMTLPAIQLTLCNVWPTLFPHMTWVCRTGVILLSLMYRGHFTIKSTDDSRILWQSNYCIFILWHHEQKWVGHHP